MADLTIRYLIALLLLGWTVGCETSQSHGPLLTTGNLWMHHPKGAAHYLNKQVDALAPAIPGPSDKAVFQRYDKNGASFWAPNWTSRLDFTGVAWDSPKAGVLIHPQYVLFASHFQRRLGEELIFHDRQGQPVSRRLAKRKTIHRIGSPDVTVGQLDRPVPSTVTHYPLLPIGHDYRLLNGAKLLVTDKSRQVHLFRINRVSQSGYEQINARKGLITSMHPAWHERLVAGDSGHPAFIIVQGQLVLISTLKGGGWAYQGPFYGGETLQRAIIDAIDSLKNSATSP